MSLKFYLITRLRFWIQSISFSWSGCPVRLESKSVILFYLLLGGEKLIHAFLAGICVKWKAYNFNKVLNLAQQVDNRYVTHASIHSHAYILTYLVEYRRLFRLIPKYTIFRLLHTYIHIYIYIYIYSLLYLSIKRDQYQRLSYMSEDSVDTESTK